MAKIVVEVCDICGKVHKNLRDHGGGHVCEKCRWIETIDDLKDPVLKRMEDTYNRLKPFKELGLDIAEIESYLNKVEESLKADRIEIVRTQIVGNFEKVAELETTLIFAKNIGDLTNKMLQANVALMDENEKLKKQTESLEKDKVELSDRINNLSKKIEGLNETTNTLRNENKEFKNQIKQLENLKGKEVEYENQINRLNKKIEESNKNADILTNENKKLKNKTNRLNKDINGLNKNIYTLTNENKELKNQIDQLKEPKVLKVSVPDESILHELFSGKKGTHAAKKIKNMPDLERQQYLDKIIPKLKDRDMIVRRSAARALGALGDAKAIEPLIEALKDKSEEVRGSAAEALGDIGDANAFKPLMVALRDKSIEVRQSAGKALAKIRAKQHP